MSTMSTDVEASRHDPAHMQRMTELSVAQRRADKIAKLVESAPPLRPEQIARLRRLIDSVPQLNTANDRAGRGGI